MIILDIPPGGFSSQFYETKKVLKEILVEAQEIKKKLETEIIACPRCRTLGSSCECILCHGTGLVNKWVKIC